METAAGVGICQVMPLDSYRLFNWYSVLDVFKISDRLAKSVSSGAVRSFHEMEGAWRRFSGCCFFFEEIWSVTAKPERKACDMTICIAVTESMEVVTKSQHSNIAIENNVDGWVDTFEYFGVKTLPVENPTRNKINGVIQRNFGKNVEKCSVRIAKTKSTVMFVSETRIRRKK